MMSLRGVTLISVCALLITVSLGSPGRAGRDLGVMVTVHVLPHDNLRTCSRDFPEIRGCSAIATTYAGCGDVDVFPVFFFVSEYLGLEYGLTWPGSGSCAFTSCSDLSIGSIEQPGDGISQVWTSCQWGPSQISVVPGFGWIEVSEPGRVSMVPHPERWAIYILDCLEGLDEPVENHGAGLCGESGDHPCWLWPDMGLNKICSSATDCVNTGDTLNYTISYENQYWDALDDVVVVDYLPNGAEYVSASDGGVYDPGTHTVT